MELRIILGTDGTVHEIRLISGPPLLVKAAMDSVQQRRYGMTILGGEPVEADGDA